MWIVRLGSNLQLATDPVDHRSKSMDGCFFAHGPAAPQASPAKWIHSKVKKINLNVKWLPICVKIEFQSNVNDS